MRSKSVEGYSAIVVSARDDANSEEIDELADDLQRVVDRSAARLPSDLPEKPAIVKLDPDRQPVIELLVVGAVDEGLLRESAVKVQDEVRELSGVAGTDRRGYHNKEVRILIDPLAMHRLGITYAEIQSAIEARNITQTGGALESFVAERDVIAVGRHRAGLCRTAAVLSLVLGILGRRRYASRCIDRFRTDACVWLDRQPIHARSGHPDAGPAGR